MNELETDRLIGVPLTRAHFTDIRSLHSDPRVTATLSEDGAPFSEDQTRDFLARAGSQWLLFRFGLWHFRERESGDFVGYCGIKHTIVEGADEIELAYAVRFDHWGKGLASEMSRAALKFGFEEVHLDRIVALTLPHNAGSRAVMEKCGFVFQRDIVHAGLPHVLYRLSRGEFSR